MSRKIWMDSGAFSAFTLGEQHSVAAYCRFLQRNAQYIDHAAVMDVIGDAEGTWQNQLRMESLGTSPVPCFHYGESVSYLTRYIEKYDYLALGGMVPISTPQLIEWLDDIWDMYLVDGAGHPRIRVHGFGLTTFELMERYPWYSVDSSSWLQSGGFGVVLLMDAEGKLYRVNISKENSGQEIRGQHFLTETPANQEKIQKIVESYGFKVEELMNHHEPRRLVSALTYKRYGDAWGLKPFVKTNLGLFESRRDPGSKRMANTWDRLEIYLAGNVSGKIEKSLFDNNCDRMLTYHYIKDNEPKNWKQIKAAIRGEENPFNEN